MSVSIADMERVELGGDSLRMGNDMGNVIELGDLNDDLGLSMLMNPSKATGPPGNQEFQVNRAEDSRTMNVSAFSPPPQQQERQFNFSSSHSLGGIDTVPLEPLEPISFSMNEPVDMGKFGGGPVEVNVKQDSLFQNSQTATGPNVHLASPRDPELEKKEKSDYLNKLQRLEAKGFPVARKFTLDNSLDDIKAEYFRLVDARQLETSIKFQRQMLMGAITGMEWLNGRFDPFDVKLDGWSESVHENVEDFDEIFEELYDKYKDRGKMSPEMRLVMAVGGSGFMCHVSNTFFRSKMPSMDNVLRQNPELARQMAAAAASQAGPGFGNFMGMAMNVQQPVAQNSTTPAGAFFGSSAVPPMTPQNVAAAPERQTARRDMAGPSGVDDILKTFEEARRTESMTASQVSGYATQPAVAAAAAAAADNRSAISAEEMMSQGTAVTGGGRRRRRAQAVGNTIALNV